MPYKDKERQRQFGREWRAQRRADWLLGKSCAVCASIDRLEIDHIDPSQKTDHKIWSWSRERRDAELEKCQVLCKKCHDKKSIKTGIETGLWEPVKHGSCSMYNKRGCRCTPCTHAVRDYRRSRRAVGKT